MTGAGMTSRILVVDDEADLELLITQKFRKEIRKGELSFVFALNGEQALQKIRESLSSLDKELFKG